MIKYYLNGVLVGVDSRRQDRDAAELDSAMHRSNCECTFDCDKFFQGIDNLVVP